MSPGTVAFPAFLGAAISTALANIGAAYGTAKSGVSYSSWKLLKQMTCLIATF